MYNGTSDDICDEFYRVAEEHFGECTGGKEAEVILGIKVDWDFDRCTVKLRQRAHTEKFLVEFGHDLGRTKAKRTPLPLNVDARDNTGRRVGPDEWDYFKWCGFANWLATGAIIDIAGAVNLCGGYSQNPGIEHVELQKHVLRYLAGTMDKGITYHGALKDLSKPFVFVNKLMCSVDSDHGGCHDTKKSSIVNARVSALLLLK